MHNLSLQRPHKWHTLAFYGLCTGCLRMEIKCLKYHFFFLPKWKQLVVTVGVNFRLFLVFVFFWHLDTVHTERRQFPVITTMSSSMRQWNGNHHKLMTHTWQCFSLLFDSLMMFVKFQFGLMPFFIWDTCRIDMWSIEGCFMEYYYFLHRRTSWIRSRKKCFLRYLSCTNLVVQAFET